MQSPLDRAGRDAALSGPQCGWPTALQGSPHGPARCLSAASLSAPGDVVWTLHLWTVRGLLALGARTRPIVPCLSNSLPDLSHCPQSLCLLLCRGDLTHALGGSGGHCHWRFSAGKDLTSCMSKPTVCSLERL